MRVSRRLLRAAACATFTFPLLLASPAGAATGWSVPTCGGTGGRVLLTFDDWAYGHPTKILAFARELKERNVGAVFFPVREFSVAYQRQTGVSLLDKVRAKGMWVGNHTWSHVNLNTASSSTVRYQIRHGVQGGYLRPPYGAYNDRVRTIARDLDHRLCTWTIDTGDWQGYSASRIRTSVREKSRAGSVVLMHLQTHSYDALPGIIRDVRAKGLQLCRPASGRTKMRIPYPIPC
ncbi:MAG: polysaccharide deacetylase family protein [Actinomycetes bacterium]